MITASANFGALNMSSHVLKTCCGSILYLFANRSRRNGIGSATPTIFSSDGYFSEYGEYVFPRDPAPATIAVTGLSGGMMKGEGEGPSGSFISDARAEWDNVAPTVVTPSALRRSRRVSGM